MEQEKSYSNNILSYIKYAETASESKKQMKAQSSRLPKLQSYVESGVGKMSNILYRKLAHSIFYITIK